MKQFIKINDEKSKASFHKFSKNNEEKVLLKTVLDAFFLGENIAYIDADEDIKSNFKVITNFVEKKGCIVNVFPVYFEENEIGAVVFEKSKCLLVGKDQLSNFRRTYASQCKAFDWVI
ncbi:MAG: hypothetical protein ACK5N8_04810 [Alphaproteobacteria bacterium]